MNYSIMRTTYDVNEILGRIPTPNPNSNPIPEPSEMKSTKDDNEVRGSTPELLKTTIECNVNTKFVVSKLGVATKLCSENEKKIVVDTRG